VAPRHHAARKMIRDPVHGYVGLDVDLVEGIVDTRWFQRLRSIRQLGLTYMVYPGAVHTRFEHSIGAAHVASRTLDALIENTRSHVLDSLKRVDEHAADQLEDILNRLGSMRNEIVAAALLHDVGHLMLSHVFEQAMKDYLLLKLGRLPQQSKHEEITVYIVEKFSKNIRNISVETVLDILKCAYGLADKENNENKVCNKPEIQLASSLISSNIDVDRLDYVLRDSYYSGALEGQYDLERFYAVVSVVPLVRGGGSTPEGREGRGRLDVRLGVIDKGVSVIENILLSRVYMYNDVYLHTVSMIYNGVAARLIALLYTLNDVLADIIPSINCIKVIFDSDKNSGIYDKCLLALTDSVFYTIVSEIVRLVDERDERLRERLQGSSSRDSRCSGLLALYLAARSIVERKHWSALIADGARARNIVSLLLEKQHAIMQKIINGINEFIVFSYGRYTAYETESPIYVYMRQRGVTRRIEQLTNAVVASELADKPYAKVLIAFPALKDLSYGDQPLWALKKGKPVMSLDEARALAEWLCGKSAAGETLQQLAGAADAAIELASRITAISGGY